GTNTNCPTFQSSANALILDGSGLTAQLHSDGTTNTILTKSGVTIVPARFTVDGGPITDANGNTITETSNVYTDSLGVQELTMSGLLDGTHDLPFSTYTYPTSSGSASVTANFHQYAIQTPSWGCG